MFELLQLKLSFASVCYIAMATAATTFVSYAVSRNLYHLSVVNKITLLRCKCLQFLRLMAGATFKREDGGAE